MSIKFIESLNCGNKFSTISKNDFINRVNTHLPTYEFTGESDTKVKLYFDIDFYVSSEDFNLATAEGIEKYSIHHITETLKKYINIVPNFTVATFFMCYYFIY